MWRTAYYDIARPSIVTAYHTFWPYLAVAALLPIFRLTQPPPSYTVETFNGAPVAGEYFPNPDFPDCGAESRAEQVATLSGESWTKHNPILSDDPPMISWSSSSSEFPINKYTNWFVIGQFKQWWLWEEWHIYSTYVVNSCMFVQRWLTPGGKLLRVTHGYMAAATSVVCLGCSFPLTNKEPNKEPDLFLVCWLLKQRWLRNKWHTLSAHLCCCGWLMDTG